jgi:hypothetical protein
MRTLKAIFIAASVLAAVTPALGQERTCEDRTVLSQELRTVIWGEPRAVTPEADGRFKAPDGTLVAPPAAGWVMYEYRAKNCDARWKYVWKAPVATPAKKS